MCGRIGLAWSSPVGGIETKCPTHRCNLASALAITQTGAGGMTHHGAGSPLGLRQKLESRPAVAPTFKSESPLSDSESDSTVSSPTNTIPSGGNTSPDFPSMLENRAVLPVDSHTEMVLSDNSPPETAFASKSPLPTRFSGPKSAILSSFRTHGSMLTLIASMKTVRFAVVGDRFSNSIEAFELKAVKLSSYSSKLDVKKATQPCISVLAR
eukprot:3935201-Rhodomonas_salina.1